MIKNRISAWQISDSTKTQLFWEEIFTLQDLQNTDLEQLTYVLVSSSFQELTEFLTANGIELAEGDLSDWAYTPEEAARYSDFNFFGLDGKYCLVCEVEVPRGRKICDDCFSETLHYEWCIGCDEPDTFLCDTCAGTTRSESMSTFRSLRIEGKQITESDFPSNYLRRYKVSERDRIWGDNYVRFALEDAWLHWDNQQSVRKQLILPVPASVKRWNGKFPYFDNEIRQWSLSEEDPGASGLSTAWIWAVILGITFWLLPISFILVKNAEKKQKEQYRAAYNPVPLRRAEEDFINQLANYIGESADRQINEKLSFVEGGTPEEWADSVSGLWQPLAPRPQLPDRDLTPKEAEEFVTGLLKYFGLEGTRATRYSKDGGVDVESHQLVVQVKHQVAPVGVKVVREIYGVAASHEKKAAVFAKSGFTREAIDFAEKTGVLLYSYTPALKGSTARSAEGITKGILAVLE